MAVSTFDLKEQLEQLIDEAVARHLSRSQRPDHLTAREFGERLAIDEQRVRKMIRRGEITRIDLNQGLSDRPMWRIPIAEYDRFVAAHTVQATS